MSKRVRNTTLVRVSQTGSIALPKGWMKENNVNPGDILTLVNLNDGVIVVRSRGSRVEEIASKLAKQWQDSGKALDSILKTLQDVHAESDKEIS